MEIELTKDMSYGSIIEYELTKLCKSMDDKIKQYYDYCKNDNKIRLA